MGKPWVNHNVTHIYIYICIYLYEWVNHQPWLEYYGEMGIPTMSVFALQVAGRFLDQPGEHDDLRHHLAALATVDFP